MTATKAAAVSPTLLAQGRKKKMNVLHLSDAPLSGSPVRISQLLNKYTEHKSRHITWEPVIQGRLYDTDLVGSQMTKDEIKELLDWADVVHYHNRWRRQKIFANTGLGFPGKKKSVIQIHSPRQSEDFSDEVASGLPFAVVAQYQVREWPELTYIVPNVVDINAPAYKRELPPMRTRAVVSYSPSNCNGKGWNSKSYEIVAPILKKMSLAGSAYFQLITSQPHDMVMSLKRTADIGIDEISTGSYHLSSLEYLALAVPCFANIDQSTAKVIKDLTGATTMPWLLANKENFKSTLEKILKDKSWQSLGTQSRDWMERFWNPQFLAKQYIDLYEDL